MKLIPVIALVLPLMTALFASAQVPDSVSASAVITGSVRGIGTGGLVERVTVCVTVPDARFREVTRCAAVDSTTHYRLEGLAEGTWRVRVVCEPRHPIWTMPLGAEDIAVAEGVTTHRDWLIDETPCDSRPLRRIAGLFRGYFTSGFEESRFVPCAEDAWFLPSDSLRTEPYDERRAWVTLSGSVLAETAWPRTDHGDPYPRYYVRWSGTIVGPGRYGHMGISAFEITVDSIYEIRIPRQGDCPKVGDRESGAG